MIRFIDLGKQIAVDETDPDYPRQFAFYNTQTDKFIELGQNGHVWDSWFDILMYAPGEDQELIGRLWNLSPQWSKEDIESRIMHRLERWRRAAAADAFPAPSWVDELLEYPTVKRILEADKDVAV